MNKHEIVKYQPVITVEIIESEPHTIVNKTIIKKKSGIVSILSLNGADNTIEKIFPFDSYAQIIHGRAEIEINSKSFMMETGSSIVIPAHTPHRIKANERFKMILTNLKDNND